MYSHKQDRIYHQERKKDKDIEHTREGTQLVLSSETDLKDDFIYIEREYEIDLLYPFECVYKQVWKHD